ncbi:MAG: CoA transferase [Saprospiraceae bacterium]|nr:CoA transferase [Saprospiraceae bacterium]
MFKISEFGTFEGLKVVDVSSVLAGPSAASFFAELGANVVKIENSLTGGDATRQWKLESEEKDSPYSAYYFSANFKKQVVMLDLTSDEGQNILSEHLSQADIFISNYQKSVATKLDLLPEKLINKYPNLIIAQLSAYDFDDARAGYDLVMQGETGWISMNGYDRNHMSKLPVAIIDLIASHQMKEAILIALLKKTMLGYGSIIHVSLYKSALSALANQATNYLLAGHIAKPIGTLHPNIAPYGDMFETNDQIMFMLAVGSDRQFEKLWNTLNFSEKEYHNFEYNSDRLKNRALLQNCLQQKFSTLNMSSVRSLLNGSEIPFCEIKSIDEVLDQSSAQVMINVETVEGRSIRSMRNVAFEIL